MGQGAELQIPLVAASALSRREIFQPGIVHREVQQAPHRVGQGELLQHRCRKNVAVHNSKDSWVNSRRCQIGTYDTDFVSAEKRQHPELTGFRAGGSAKGQTSRPLTGQAATAGAATRVAAASYLSERMIAIMNNIRGYGRSVSGGTVLPI